LKSKIYILKKNILKIKKSEMESIKKDEQKFFKFFSLEKKLLKSKKKK
jgi:hypothetical protein